MAERRGEDKPVTGDAGAGRWWRRLGRRREPALVPVTEVALRVIAECDDDAVASSTVLGPTGLAETDPVVLRHRLRLAAAGVGPAVAILEEEDYAVVERLESGHGPVELIVACWLRADPVAVSRERTRLASLTSRHGGTVVAWDLAVPDGTAG